MNATLRDVLAANERLGGAVKQDGDQYFVPCPLHGDKNPSLHVGEKDGKLILHAFCCEAEFRDLLDAFGLLNENGSAEAESRKSSAPRKKREAPKAASWVVVAGYQYRDESGKQALYTISREELHNLDGTPVIGERGKPEKRFNSKGITKEKRVPYHLDELRSARDSGDRVYFVEGEKCADFIRDRLGAFATTCGNVDGFDP